MTVLCHCVNHPFPRQRPERAVGLWYGATRGPWREWTGYEHHQRGGRSRLPGGLAQPAADLLEKAQGNLSMRPPLMLRCTASSVFNSQSNRRVRIEALCHMLHHRRSRSAWYVQEDGCVEPKGSELKILTALDGLFNRCLRLGGWDIQVVVPMSKVPVATTRGDGVDLGQTVVPHVGYPPARGTGYPPNTRVFPNSHPKHLLAGNYQGNFSGAQRILMATAGLLELSKAIAAFLGVAVPVVYEAAAVSTVLRSCVLATYAEACDPTTLGAASATALTSKLAAENGTSLLIQVEVRMLVLLYV